MAKGVANPRSIARFIAAALFAVLALLAPAVRAQTDAYNAALTRAVAAKERALNVNEPSRWEEALHRFQEAADVRATREAKYEVGFAAQQLRQDDLAVEAYQAALALDLQGAPRDKAAAFVTERAPAMARIQIGSAAEGGQVFVRGVYRGRSSRPFVFVVFPGPASVEVVAPDGSRTSRSFTAGRGTTTLVDFGPTGPATLPGGVPAKTPPSSHGLAGAPPTPGTTPTVGAAPAGGGAASPSSPLPSVSDGSGAGWIALSTGAAAVLIAAVTVPVSNAALDDARLQLTRHCGVLANSDVCETALPGAQTAAQSDVDTIATWKALRTGAWVGLGVGAALLVTGIVLVARPSDGAVSATQPGGALARLLPDLEVAPTGAVVGLRGMF